MALSVLLIVLSVADVAASSALPRAVQLDKAGVVGFCIVVFMTVRRASSSCC
jgi:hypothetical protein